MKLPYVADAFTGTWKRPTTTTEYDAMGRAFRVTDPLGNITETSYDRVGRATGVKLPAVDVYGLGVQATYSRSNYDANGNVVQTIDARGRVLTNEYDAHNRLTKTTDALGAETLFAYDKGNNRLSVTDDNGNVTAFTYDAQKRVKTETYPGSQVLTYGYDKVNKTSRTDALSRQTTYAYDVRNRLTTVTYVSGVQGTRTYGYDAAGQLLSVTESAQPSADVTYTYDALGRVSSEVSYGFTHTYTYDLAGNRIATDYGTGRSETRVFDALNRPLQISEGGRLTDYYYDLAGRAVGLMSGNDQWSVNEYDAQSRLMRRTLKANASGWNPLLAELTFAYDALGNLRRQQESWPGEIARVGVRSTTLSYDSGDRLRQELVVDDSGQKSTDYHYDGVGNRTLKLERTNGVLQKQTSYTSNVRNQLTSWEEENGSGIDLRSTTLGYDVAGNRISQALTTHGPVPATANTSYAWDYDNRLTGVTLPGSLTHSYAYDYRTRRLQRSEPGNNPVAMTFSGGLSVAEFEVIDSQLGTLNSQPSVEYQRGPDMGGGVGGLLYSLRSGTAKYNLSNGRGDVVAQSDASGDLTWTASYEAYGKRPVETGSNLDRQRANTKEEDPTGLLNEGFRYRDLETGTWLSRDPAGFVDGPNLYAYVRQNPWTNFDPDGLLLRQCLPKYLQWLIPPASGLAMADAQLDSITNSTKLAGDTFEVGRKTPVKSAISGVALGGTYHAMNMTGMMTFSEGWNREALEFSGGSYEVREMGASESRLKTGLGLLQIAGTVLGFRGGGSPKLSVAEAPGLKPPPLPNPAPSTTSTPLLQQQKELSLLVNRQGAVVDRWLSASSNRWAQLYRSNLNTNPNFSAGIRGRILDVRMRGKFRDMFGDVPGVRIDQTITGTGSRLRPDLYLPDVGRRSAIFDVGSPSKVGDILKYQGMADDLVPLVPAQWFR